MRKEAENPHRAALRELARLSLPRPGVPSSSITPMLAEARERPFSAAGWVFELKYDGYRLLAGHAPGGGVRLSYRSGRDATASYPHLALAVSRLPFGGLLIDGEAVALDASGRPSFGLLQRSAQSGTAAVMFAFDLLFCEGHDLRTQPLVVRQALLRKVIAAAGPQEPALRCSQVIETRGEDLFAAAAALGLEGIVAKRAASPYRAGRSADWLKIRADRVGDFAIVGYGLAPGSAPPARGDLRRLHLAVRHESAYRYVGSVGSGLGEAARGDLRARLAAARPAPAAGAAKSAARAAGGRPGPWLAGQPRADRSSFWIAPDLVCEVRYKEWTDGGNLRQPVFLRLRDDKRPEECEAPAAAQE